MNGRLVENCRKLHRDYKLGGINAAHRVGNQGDHIRIASKLSSKGVTKTTSFRQGVQERRNQPTRTIKGNITWGMDGTAIVRHTVRAYGLDASGEGGTAKK